MDRLLIGYIPPILQEIREFSGIMETEQSEVETLWDAVDGILENMFIFYAGEVGVSRWESILGITPKATETLEGRKFEIMAKLNAYLPYTLTKLEGQLYTLCGEDMYSIELDHDGYRITVHLALMAKSKYAAVEALVREMIPCNLVLTISLQYNTHGNLRGKTHGEMGEYTHYNLRNEAL